MAKKMASGGILPRRGPRIVSMCFVMVGTMIFTSIIWFHAWSTHNVAVVTEQQAQHTAAATLESAAASSDNKAASRRRSQKNRKQRLGNGLTAKQKFQQLHQQHQGRTKEDDWRRQLDLYAQLEDQLRQESKAGKDKRPPWPEVLQQHYNASNSSSSTLDNMLPNNNNTHHQNGAYPLNRSAPVNTQIPPVLLFTHRTNLLGPHADPHDLRLFDNVLHTIESYAHLWRRGPRRRHHSKRNNSTTKRLMRVWFLDNAECVRVLRRTEPRLLPYFRNETVGKYQGDVCRAAAQYYMGGYYFDVDMKVIVPVQLQTNTTFASAQTNEDMFFNSYVASTPRHAILKDQLELLLLYYQQAAIWGRTIDEDLENWDKTIGPDQALNITTDIFTADQAVRIMLNRGLIGPYSLKAAYDYHYEMAMDRQLESESDIMYDDVGNGALDDPDAADMAARDDDDDPTFLIERFDEEHDDPSYLPEDSRESFYAEYDAYDLDYADDHPHRQGQNPPRMRHRPNPIQAEILFEDDLNEYDKRLEWYPFLGYQDEGVGCCCNWVVHNAWDRRPHFYSRVMGNSELCEHPARVRDPQTLWLPEGVEEAASRAHYLYDWMTADKDANNPLWPDGTEPDLEDLKRAVEAKRKEEEKKLPPLPWPYPNRTWAERRAMLPTYVEYYHLPATASSRTQKRLSSKERRRQRN